MTDLSIPTRFHYADGGRSAAGYRGNVGDCVVRAICNAATLDYRTVYDALNDLRRIERPRSPHGHSHARNGVRPVIYRRYLDQLGWTWTPTMAIGQGCTVHLCAAELPLGRLIIRLSRHLTAMIDGCIFDTFDPSRGGTRCVYGYWQPPQR
jgi:hypothetical protein